MSPVPPLLVDLEAFLFNSASQIFQLASHKHICLEVLRILWWDKNELHELVGHSQQSLGSGGMSERSVKPLVPTVGASRMCPKPLLAESSRQSRLV